jgi:hypothetical protein
MAIYRVWAKMTTYCYIDVEAEDEDAALEFAEDADGGDFINSDTGDWEIMYDSTEELK